jgi:hypothetical protein
LLKEEKTDSESISNTFQIPNTKVECNVMILKSTCNINGTNWHAPCSNKMKIEEGENTFGSIYLAIPRHSLYN